MMTLHERRTSFFAVLAMCLAGLLLAASTSAGSQDAQTPHCTSRARVDHSVKGGKAVDLSVRCNYKIRSIEVRSKNRRFSRVAKVPALSPSRSADSASCHRRHQRRVICRGRVTAGTRVTIRSRIRRSACSKPQARFAVSVFGAPDCSGTCTDVGITTDAVTLTGRSLGCS